MFTTAISMAAFAYTGQYGDVTIPPWALLIFAGVDIFAWYVVGVYAGAFPGLV